MFLHKPLWTYAERARAAGNDDPTNWQQVEALLGDRPHTVFSGHVHHYVQYDRNGMKYYHLATTGGGSRLRGVPYGEFDHVTWLVMERDGPHVSNLMLDGILPADAVTEKGIARFRSFLGKTVIEIAPILVGDDSSAAAGNGSFTSGEIHLRLTNGFDAPVEIEGTIDGLPLRGLTVDPAKLVLRAAPGESEELSVNLAFAEPMEFKHLAQTLLTARLKTTGEKGPLTAERTVPVVIDQKHSCPLGSAPTIDGKLDSDANLRFGTGSTPIIVGAEGQWNGPGDAGVEFDVSRDEDHVYVIARVTDDVVTEGDALTAYVDARPIAARAQNGHLSRGGYAIQMAAPATDATTQVDVRTFSRAKTPDGFLGRAAANDNGYQVEFAIPSSALGKAWQSFQLCLAVSDRDAEVDDDCRILWRGSNGFERVNMNYGHFVAE